MQRTQGFAYDKLRSKNKIKNTQGMQIKQENYASEKQKYANASHAQAVLAWQKVRIESILFFMQETQTGN